MLVIELHCLDSFKKRPVWIIKTGLEDSIEEFCAVVDSTHCRVCGFTNHIGSLYYGMFEAIKWMFVFFWQT